MASLASFAVSNISAFTARQQRPARRHQAQPCYAMADDGERKLTFESNKRAALGFTESDSAGQTNIFAVEPKTYVAGTKADQTTAEGNSTAGAAAVAGTVAVGAVIGGLLLVTGDAPDLGPTGDFLTLSEYKAQFVTELAVAAPPPAAPAVADE